MLLTRPPLYSPRRAFALDLHASSTPPTFVLSQDQTLHLKSSSDLLVASPRRLLADRAASLLPQHTAKPEGPTAYLGQQPRSHTFSFEATQNVKDHAPGPLGLECGAGERSDDSQSVKLCLAFPADRE